MSTVLLIDDDKDMLALTCRWLEKAGYEVLCATSGSDALALLADNTPDLILLDYAMPDMDGPEVLGRIRSMDGCRSIPVIYRTGMEDIVIGDEAGVYGVVPKSKGKPYLMNVISEALGSVQE